jgi:hypothetical protein
LRPKQDIRKRMQETGLTPRRPQLVRVLWDFSPVSTFKGVALMLSLRPPPTTLFRNAPLQELTELEQQLCDGSDRFFANLKLIVIDSLGTAFAPLIGGGTHFGHSLLVSVVQTLQVCLCAPLVLVHVYLVLPCVHAKI